MLVQYKSSLQEQTISMYTFETISFRLRIGFTLSDCFVHTSLAVFHICILISLFKSLFNAIFKTRNVPEKDLQKIFKKAMILYNGPLCQSCVVSTYYFCRYFSRSLSSTKFNPFITLTSSLKIGITFLFLYLTPLFFVLYMKDSF